MNLLHTKLRTTIVHKHDFKELINLAKELYGGTFVFVTAKLANPSLRCWVFYTPVAHAQGSNWFTLHSQGGRWYISNGENEIEQPIKGVIAKNGDIIYSAWNHDYVVSADGSVWIDGGNINPRYGSMDDDYLPEVVDLIVDRDRLVIKELLIE